MGNSDPEFIKCAMQAIEEGVRAQDIKEECACRMGLTLESTNQTKE